MTKIVPEKSLLSKKEEQDVMLDPTDIAAKIEGSEVVAGNVLLGDVYLYQEGKVTPAGREALKDSGIDLPPEPTPVNPPAINSISPSQGADGSQLVITGTDFGAAGGKVQVGTEDAALAEWTSTQITVAVLQGAQPMGAPMVVTVTTADGQQAYAPGGYTFLDAGNIDG